LSRKAAHTPSLAAAAAAINANENRKSSKAKTTSNKRQQQQHKQFRVAALAPGAAFMHNRWPLEQ